MGDVSTRLRGSYVVFASLDKSESLDKLSAFFLFLPVFEEVRTIDFFPVVSRKGCRLSVSAAACEGITTG